jgi:hypothetical protein
VIVAKVDEGECYSGVFVEFKIFKADIVDEGQVHGREGRDGYCLLGGIWGVYIAFGFQGPYGCEVCHVEFSDQVQAIGISCSFPAVMGSRIAFPPKEILQFAVASGASRAKNLFHFIFGLVIDQFWKQFRVILAMFGCFCVW